LENRLSSKGWGINEIHRSYTNVTSVMKGELHFDPGLPVFLSKNTQMGKIYQINIPNGHKIYRMAIK
jgi:hypothetical protein